jgi:Hint domain
MDLRLGGRSSLSAFANGKATLTTTRRSLIASWKLRAGITLGLGLAGRSESAQANNNNNSCFLAGTRIKTTKGDVCIEELRIGDRVSTVSGETKRIKFIRRRAVSRGLSQSCTGAVKIRRFAIDGKVPHEYVGLLGTPAEPLVRFPHIVPLGDFRKPIEKVRHSILGRRVEIGGYGWGRSPAGLSINISSLRGQ